MTLAIDDSGSFAAGSDSYNFFVGVHIRQRRTLFKAKQAQFTTWEDALPRSLKNAKGEIKSSSLTDRQLEDFALAVIRSHPRIGITAVSMRPCANPPTVVEKHRSAQTAGIIEGVRGYAGQGKMGLAKTYEDFGNWFRKLSYVQYLKITLLGYCIVRSLNNEIGHAVSGGYDGELPGLKFVIDRDFIKGPQPNAFWREVLRNQLYGFSREDPLPLLDRWREAGHPFLERYTEDGRLNFNRLFWDRCSFLDSRETFEIRVADAVNTVFWRFTNRGACASAYDLTRNCILRDGIVTEFVLKEFDATGNCQESE
jgi:hypothetical protein